MSDNHEKSSKFLFKRQILVTSIFVLAIVLVTISGSFAIFSKTASGDEYNVVQVGELELSYVDLSEEGNVLSLASGYPTSDEVGSVSVPYRFSVENTGTLQATYTVKVIDDVDTISADGCADKLMDSTYLRYKFDNQDPKTLSDVKVTDKNEYIVHSGTLQPFESNIHEIRLWVSETSPNSMLGKHYHAKVIIEIVQATGSDGLVRPVDSRIGKAFASENLGENCKTYNDGVDTFLVGQCNQNYVWYSGKLWRVVLKNNETGAVKMVTDNAITNLFFDSNDGGLGGGGGGGALNSVSLEQPYMMQLAHYNQDDYINQWLMQEFLPTLHDYEENLVIDSVWDETLNDSNTPSRPLGTNTIVDTVGLLNAYEYYTTYNNSEGLATYETGYLNNSIDWWLMSGNYVQYDGSLKIEGTTFILGVRPSINLQNDINITSGNGTQSEPYRLEGDSQQTVNGTTLLSTRYSGEYVTFNNELYRIVGVESNKTKITAVDKPNVLSNNSFDNSTEQFADSSVKTDLETYYQNNIVAPYKSMVELNQTWYLGAVMVGESYKASICKTVERGVSISVCEKTDTSVIASVGLPRVGEMFTSQISRTARLGFWTITPSISCVWYVQNVGSLSVEDPIDAHGVRPSMYLKSNVVISSTNTGDGTYEHPYDIELGM